MPAGRAGREIRDWALSGVAARRRRAASLGELEDGSECADPHHHDCAQSHGQAKA
jgi:hypothetical protein